MNQDSVTGKCWLITLDSLSYGMWEVSSLVTETPQRDILPLLKATPEHFPSVYPAMLSLCSVTWRINPPGQLKNLWFSAQHCCVLQPSSEELNMALERSAAGFKKNKRFSSLYCSPPVYLPVEFFILFLCLFSCWLLSCSCSVCHILLWNGTSYSVKNCLWESAPLAFERQGRRIPWVHQPIWVILWVPV